ncbi:glycerophosphoryl diester phosphodiesterase [Plesiocystis pacifica SIR-1]|uniref:Glycerophosphoryl diester phosphodiesterase n=2 Tax=Plesiocystis pacifica TaxID=191768 RepID=A6G8Z5_9BACT|nr:glycerophosphoryl diester phosphodiesterase [Plesiocystis pacifica SIR-1]
MLSLALVLGCNDRSHEERPKMDLKRPRGAVVDHDGKIAARIAAAEAGSLPLIVAHRGASKDAPENTLAAFRLGFEQGADAIEGDFWLSADGVIVAMHDRSLARTTATPSGEGDGREVTALTWEELAHFDVGSWDEWAARGYAGEPIPTLAQVLELVAAQGEGHRAIVEIKDGPRIVPALLETLAASGLAPEQVAIIAFDAEVIAALTKARSEGGANWPAYWLSSFEEGKGGALEPSAAQVVAEARRVGADGVDLWAKALVLDPELAPAVRAAGLELHVWTVDDEALARQLVALGVDSITTNIPAALRASLAPGSTAN